jgi:protein O-mannosyl-transferase
MSIEQPPAESPLTPGSEPQPPMQSSARRTVAILAACAILALPVAYLALHKASSTPEAVSPPAPAVSNIATLEAAVRANPTVDNRINLSQAYINGNDPVHAITVLQAVIAADPNNLIAWNNLCVAHVMQQDYRSALEECKRAVQIGPTFQLAANNLKWAQDENDKTLKALATMEQTPPAARDAKFYLAEGLDYLHVGNYDQAIKAWQSALGVDPKNALAANNIGDAYMLKKQPANALQWFQRSLTIDPSLQIAKNNAAWANDEISKMK